MSNRRAAARGIRRAADKPNGTNRLMDILSMIACGVGAFYILAALILMRSMAMDRLLDQALEGITLKPTPAKESGRRWLLGASALAYGMGGAALILLNIWAVPLFVVGAVLQLAYLVWARSAFVPEDALEARGRRQTINAAMLYFVATTFVCWLGWRGKLAGWDDTLALAIPATGLFLLVIVARHLLWQAPRVPHDASAFMEAAIDDAPAPLPLHRIRLEPSWGRFCVVDADTGEDRDPDVYLPTVLAERVYLWSLAFQACDDDSRSICAEFEDLEHERLHREEGNAIVAELAVLYGNENVSGPIYPAKISYVGPAGLNRI